MANRVRGIRQKLPPNSILGTGAGARGTTQPAKAIPISTLLNQPGQGGQLPLFAGLTSAMFDAFFGTTQGSIIYRNSTGWVILTPGLAGDVLESGGSGANPSWQPSGGGFTYEGAWSATTAYSAGEVVTYGGSAYLCYANIAAPSGGISLDGFVGGTFGFHNTSKSVSLTTTAADLIVVVVSTEQNTTGSVTSTVSGVSDGSSLTWTKRTGQQARNTSGASGPSTSTIEVWTAPASGALTGDSITVSLAAQPDGGCVIAFGLKDAGTFDANGSLPDFVSTGSSASASTTSSPDMLLFVNSNASFSGYAASAPSGWTQIGSGEFDSSGLGNSALNVFYEVVGGTGSQSVTASFTGGYYPNLLLDAVVSSTPGNTPPSSDDLHWLSQGSGGGSSFITAVDQFFAVSGGTLAPTGPSLIYDHAALGGV